MSGGEALDLALGLLRAPARRALLVGRPLPSGMTTMLEVAGGSPAAGDAAAASIGADRAELLEAARFFVQQVLFAEGADAYRIMGVDRDADIARIRDHHRLLLRWLHPDRTQGEQWESALAARVNQAWNQLRTPAARAAYDSRSPAPPPQPAAFADGAPAMPPMPPMPPLAPLPRVPMDTAPARRPGAGALGMAALVVACIGLGWLAFRGGSEPVTPEFRRLTAAPAPAPAPSSSSSSSSARAGTRAESAEAQPAATAKPPADSGAAAVASFVAAAAAAAPTASRPPQPATVATSEASAPAPIAIAPAIAPASVAESTRVADVAPVQPEFPSAIPHPRPPAPLPVSAPVTADTADTADPLQLFESANAMVDALSGWLVSSHDAQPAYAGPPARLEAVDERLRLHDRHGSSGRLSLEQRDWRLGEQHATVAARYRVTSRGRERETGSARIALARSGNQWQLASLNLVADP